MGELNLIPYRLKEKKQKNIVIRKILASSIIILGLLFVGIYIPRMYVNSLNEKEQSLKIEISVDENVQTENARLKTEVANLKGYADKVDIIAKYRDNVTDKVRGIEKHMKADMYLESFDYLANVIVMTGRTKNYNSISELGANLQMSKEYSNSYITNIAYDDKTGEYTFKISTIYNGGILNEKSK